MYVNLNSLHLLLAKQVKAEILQQLDHSRPHVQHHIQYFRDQPVKEAPSHVHSFDTDHHQPLAVVV
eukprot:CAMPEP_0197332746 /NCGR_PEP_ID=MMETSP0892-20130614/20919_1 /TAXON_ID=44058 ORGANISM="Aureoumbra lagunensis, Strain CCMP1510" /NCGR_SAMPLE_ID=MMETSP0892 /ASSEMBLY_ACC=CAM_ASM_000538 /LENGTH=65 /DNA_ID=CAMNT_0042831855 /DNA_START=9 /DNA_END=203 /DNA_ORIENTATION=+